jgi:Na+-transporting NADH:ubiquinone oxidoreductase subunit NqrC
MATRTQKERLIQEMFHQTMEMHEENRKKLDKKADDVTAAQLGEQEMETQLGELNSKISACQDTIVQVRDGEVEEKIQLLAAMDNKSEDQAPVAELERKRAEMNLQRSAIKSVEEVWEQHRKVRDVVFTNQVIEKVCLERFLH